MKNQTPTIQTQWKKNPHKPGNKPGKSMAVPGQSQKLRDILGKYSVGVPTQGYRPIYSQDLENDMGINPKRLDYVDIQNLSNDNLRRINALEAERRKIIEETNQKKLQLEEKHREEAWKKRYEEEQNNKKP